MYITKNKFLFFFCFSCKDFVYDKNFYGKQSL